MERIKASVSDPIIRKIVQSTYPQYRGDLLASLERAVVKVSAQSDNRTLCANCFAPLGDHSNLGELCPRKYYVGSGLYAHSVFRPLICQYEFPESAFGRDDGFTCVSGAVVFHLPSETFRCLTCFGRPA